VSRRLNVPNVPNVRVVSHHKHPPFPNERAVLCCGSAFIKYYSKGGSVVVCCSFSVFLFTALSSKKKNEETKALLQKGYN